MGDHNPIQRCKELCPKICERKGDSGGEDCEERCTDWCTDKFAHAHKMHGWGDEGHHRWGKKDVECMGSCMQKSRCKEKDPGEETDIEEGDPHTEVTSFLTRKRLL